MRDREKISKVRKLYSDPSSIENILSFLRRQGTSKIDSVRIVHLGAGLSLNEAKKAVFKSLTWSDRFRSDEEFIDSLLEDVDLASQSEVAA